MMSKARRLLWPTVAAALAFLLLIGLGFWQLRRLAWKEALISRIETRAHNLPMELPPRDAWSSLSPSDYDFNHVRLTGRFNFAHEALIYSPAPKDFGVEPGYLVITPFLLTSGGVVLVNRGFIPQSYEKGDARKHAPQGDITLAGVMRAPQSRNYFTPADDPEHGLWFTSDPEKMAKSFGLSEAAPFTVVLDSDDPRPSLSDGRPHPFTSDLDLANNHFSYAMTWFGLAAALVLMFVLYARGGLKSTEATNIL